MRAGVPPGRIMLLEDEDVLGWCIAFELGRLGYEVVVALTIKAYLETLKTFQPDLIICDQDLPDGNALHSMKALRAVDLQSGCIMITAHSPPTASELKICGIRQCMSKPFEIQQLISHVEEFFQLRTQGL
jgi:two-component system alkaline phosphatase synthesis response regulator PhoP